MGYTHTNPLRHAMATLHAQDPQGWIRAVADEVVRRHYRDFSGYVPFKPYLLA